MKHRQLKLITKGGAKRLVILLSCVGIFTFGVWFMFIAMPGQSYQGEFAPLSPYEQQLQSQLKRDVYQLSQEIGEHNYLYYAQLLQAEKYLTQSFKEANYLVKHQEYSVEGQIFNNLEVEISGSEKPEEIIIIGAHYDSVVGSPGANDNSTGVAAVLALARAFAGKQFTRTLRFVEFVNEEPPFFQTEYMGSWVYAKHCKARDEKIIGMLSLETMGYYSDRPGSQSYPLGLLNMVYPITGNFISFVGNLKYSNLLKQVVGLFREHSQFPSEGAALPDFTQGAGWSDHWSFWQEGYPALMVTDTAPFRYPFYHTLQDTPDKVNFAYLARVVAGLEQVITALAGANS